MAADPAFDVPLDRYYERVHHLWARMDEEGCVRVGIDTIGLESLGELAYISLKPTGAAVARGESIGTLEAAKMTTIISAPCTGIVIRCNEEVLRDPLLVNEDPYDRGWLMDIKPSNWEAESAMLVTGGQIEAWVASEVERLGETPSEG